MLGGKKNMVKDIDTLISMCDEELHLREYSQKYYERIVQQWNDLRLWMKENDTDEFDKAVANRYLDEKFGSHIIIVDMPKKNKEKIRAVRMLVSYQKSGEFEFRCPCVEYIFDGETGEMVIHYLEYCEKDLSYSYKTIENKRLYLHDFSSYLEANSLSFDDLNLEEMEKFFSFKDYSLSSRHNSASCIRIFLRYIFDNGKTSKDNSVYVLGDNFRKGRNLPTTYEEEEIQRMISSVERSSAIGKRDYLILLLACEYGWRASDITSFCFSNIDWDNNLISFHQNKTDVPVTFPLLSSVGNAIIDYLKHARPHTDVPEIIVSLDNVNKGKPLSSPTVHSIVTKYLKKANIKDWKNKKHGPHALRHSLATNLLKNNIAMPIISTVMGHQRTETTSIYLSLDYDKLKQCALAMPVLRSPFYCKDK